MKRKADPDFEVGFFSLSWLLFGAREPRNRLISGLRSSGKNFQRLLRAAP
jgi:hypothetical protein